jgi:hypothetical protein
MRVAPSMLYVRDEGQPAVWPLPWFGQPRFARTFLIGTADPFGRLAQSWRA